MENNKNAESGESLVDDNARSSSEFAQIGAVNQNDNLLDMRFLFVEIKKKVVADSNLHIVWWRARCPGLAQFPGLLCGKDGRVSHCQRNRHLGKWR